MALGHGQGRASRPDALAGEAGVRRHLLAPFPAASRHTVRARRPRPRGALAIPCANDNDCHLKARTAPETRSATAFFGGRRARPRLDSAARPPSSATRPPKHLQRKCLQNSPLTRAISPRIVAANPTQHGKLMTHSRQRNQTAGLVLAGTLFTVLRHRAHTGAVRRLLQRLASCGLVQVERLGRPKFHHANHAAPIHKELAAILRKTVGLRQPVGKALTPLPDERQLHALFRSVLWAKTFIRSDRVAPSRT